jgi:hypothetical protein
MNVNRDRPENLVATPMSRRSLLISFLAIPALGGVLAACGSKDNESAGSTPDDTVPDTSAPATGIEHPTDATAAVIRLGYVGGMLPPDYAFSQLPAVLVAGDGAVYAPGVMTMEYPGPLVQPVTTRTITEAGIQTLLAKADSLGLLASPSPDYTPSGDIMIADAPNTEVVLSAKGSSFTHSAYALGLMTPGGDGTKDNTPARQALLDFSLALQDLTTTVGAENLGAEGPYTPAAYRIRARVAEQSELDGITPAPTVADWPASTGVKLADTTNCATLTAEQAGTVLADATQNTYFTDGDSLYFVAAAVLLPGDPAC